MLRIVATAVSQTGAILPDQTARLLKRAVQQQDLASDCADICLAFQGLTRKFNGALLKARIIIQQQQLFCAGQRSALIDRCDEPEVIPVFYEFCAADQIEQLSCFVCGVIVYDDDLHL